jgi:AP2 domain
MIEIPLSNGRGVTVVDDEDAWAVGLRWRLHSSGYAVRGRSTLLHREILARCGVHPITVDHLNRDKLDNRRTNIRPATYSQNSANRAPRSKTGYKGVISDKGSWRAEIKDGRAIFLGMFDTAEDAARAYDEEARRRFGSFAGLNFPNENRSVDRRLIR